MRRAVGCSVVALAVVIALALCRGSSECFGADAPAQENSTITILVYHRFGPIVADSMTVTTPVFEWQLKYLREHSFTVVPLSDVVKFVKGQGHLPPRAVAITADDGHRTVFTIMKPMVERERIPVTLFIYPSAISNASYAMTWDQLVALKATCLFSIQSHSYWHPNFHTEKKRLPAGEYGEFVQNQLTKPRQILERRLGSRADMLAWPFGIYDDELITAAVKAGYVAAFTIDRRSVSASDNVMALPRYLVTDHDRGSAFAAMLSGKDTQAAATHIRQAHQN